jgi:hypothetical protein
LTRALVDVPYVQTYSPLGQLKTRELRKFRAFLDEVVRVMEDCGIRPWTAVDDAKSGEVSS